jgi:hypothetical protein
MWNVRKSGDGEFGSASGAGQGPKRRRTVWIWTERLLLASGLALLAVYGAARIESIFGSRAAREKFAVVNSYAATASRNDGEWIHPSQEFDHAGT